MDILNIKRIIEIGRRMYAYGMCASNDGNISVLDNNGTVWITATGVSKGFLKEDDILNIDMDGKVLSGSGKPSSETALHLALYRNNPKIKAVVHAHPLAATTFACAGIPLEDAVLQECVVQLGCVPLAPYALPGTEAVGESVIPLCRRYNAALMEYHGAVSWGRSLEEAYFRMETLEYYAKIMLNLRSLGIDRKMSREQVDALISLREKWGVDAGGTPKHR